MNVGDVPAIRFDGFTEPWEQRKLGEVADIKTGPFGSLLHAEDYVEDGTPIVTTEHFKDGELPVVKSGLPQVSDVDAVRLSQYVARRGDILFSRVGSVDVNAEVTAAQDGWLFSGRVLRARPNQNVILPDYLHHELETDAVKASVISRAVGGTMASINTEILGQTLVCYPSLPEQRAIGSLFSRLDSLITLHQRKHDQLATLKKSLLEKMFPKPGCEVPELRFAGFTEPWEQRKLGELSCEFQSGEFISASDIVESGLYPVYGGNGLRGYTDHYNHDGFYALIGRQGALCGNVNSADGKAYFTEHAVAVQANRDNDTGFLVYLLGRMDLGQYSGQSAQPGLAVGVLKQVETSVPDKSEQRAIGSLFSHLDSLITLHQRKHDQLATLKKSLLEKMFV